MAKNIGNPTTATLQKARETFRLEIDVGGTPTAPIYTLKGHANYVQRDANGVEIGRAPGYVTVVVDDASMPAGLKTGIANLIAKLDSIALPTDV